MELVLMAACAAALVYFVLVGVVDNHAHRQAPRRIEAFKVTRLEDSYPVASPRRPDMGLTVDDVIVAQPAY